MSEQHKIFSTSEQCLTEEQLLLYLQNKLSPLEQHHVEKHLLDCELCSDALEGLRMTTSENLSETFATLNQQIDDRVNQDEKKIIPLYSWLRVAAVIVLIAVSTGTFLYLQKEQKQQEKIVAEKKPDLPPVPQNNFELKSAEPVTADKSKEFIAKEFKTPVTKARQNKNIETTANEPKLNDVTTETIAAVSEEKEKRESIPQAVAEQPMPKLLKESKIQSVAENAGATNQSYDAVAANTKKKVMPDDKTRMESQVMNSAVIIDNAKNQMQNNRYDSANFLLDEVINNNDANYLEEAMWNKSIALEKLNRKEDAKIVLQNIVVMNGKYKMKAKKKLKTW